MTGGYGNGPDIINSCSVKVKQRRNSFNSWTKWSWKINCYESYAWTLLNLKSGSVVPLMVKIFQNFHLKKELKKVFHLFHKQKMSFAGMTVEENLEMGAYLRDDTLLQILLKKFMIYFQY